MNFGWRKSTYSTAEGNCVEVAHNLTGAIAVRDSQNPDSGHVVLSRNEWQALTDKIKADHLG